MENLALFLLTTAIYLGAWCLLKRPARLSGYFKRAAMVALLCAPVNVNGSVFTILGNATAEKNNISLCSVYQKAGHDAITVVGPFNYQVAGGQALTILGVTLYQSAGQDAVFAIGLAGYQSAGQDAGVVIGLAGYQSAEQTAVTLAGLAGCQSAGESAATYAGVAFYQRAGEKSRSFGAFTALKAK